jgi:AbrB family looped-hinge helix DNA binding protein
METKLSTKGQVVLPGPLRRKLGLRPGDPLDVSAEAGRIVLTPRRARLRKPRIIIDSITGLPVLTAGPDAPVLTSRHVDEILSNFP